MKYRGFYLAANTQKYALWHIDSEGELAEHIQDFEGNDILSYTFLSDEILDGEYGDFETVKECKEFIDKLIDDELLADKKGEIKKRLEYLRGEIRAERISYGEIAELQSLEKYIDNGDVELLEWADVEEGTQ